MKRAFVSALYAWLIGVLVIFTYFYFIEKEARTKSYTPGQLGEGLGYIAAIVAVVVIPVGVAVVAPLLRTLLRKVPKMNAFAAGAAGTVISVVCLYLLATVYRACSHKYGSAFFVPNPLNEETRVLATIAASIGGVFAYQYTKRYRRDHAAARSPESSETPAA